ncbi:acyl carrier protein [Oscillospiraceae bacterium BX1]|jgi:acyl carrier protein|uniref:Acyl carrier protein n=1 Tax=Yanshouia hominis TaxID=2763673 RepID=A0ABR7NH74_9FIRM|nr:acyl carrier protein [Yanshouia hominis]
MRSNSAVNPKGGTTVIFEKVKGILAEQLDIDEDSITADSSIVEDLGADSLDIVDLVMSLEDEFDTEIPDEAIEGIKTVGDIVHYIEENAN